MMAASGKFNLSSGSPERPIYTNGQRGSLTASLDRLSSFRETSENPASSSLSSISRNCSAITQGDVMNFFRCLDFEPKSVAADLKFHLQENNFKRIMNATLGIMPDDSPAGSSKGKLLPSPLPEELKRVKANLREGSINARKRGKIFHDALSTFNKCFPSVPSRKRSRSDALSSQRTSVLLPTERSVLGPGVGKMGMQNYTTTTVSELEQQNLEERTKILVPNKRTRTSLVDTKADTRPNAFARPSGAIDKDREVLRMGNNGAVQGEDRTISITVEGWEKSKMKKKRSVIKQDISSTTKTSIKPIDGYRETKQGIQQRLITDNTSSRLNDDSHEFRPGIANVAVGAGKSDGTSQQPNMGMRSSILRTDQDNNSLASDRRDRPSGSDKERVNVRAVINKTNIRDDPSSVSPASSMKISTSTRGPRSSSSAVVPKTSPVLHRPTTPNDWEISHPPNIRKRPLISQSLAPPVGQWAGQRPQKISRTARRTNFLSIVPGSENSHVSNTINDEAGSSLPQIMVKREHFTHAATFSESEEIENNKSREKSDEIDEKSGQNGQKMSSTMLLSMRKNKLVSGDGVRRQGRTGRAFTTTRSILPDTVEKLGGVGTAKQLRSARHGVEKAERVGRPPTRKLSDRKAYTRQKNTIVNAASDFLVGSDDGHEELLAAVKAVINNTYVFSSPFWRQMETYYCFISDIYLTYLKQQVNLSNSSTPFQIDCSDTDTGGKWLIKCERDACFNYEAPNGDPFPENLILQTSGISDITLCQRLIASLISENEMEDIYCNGTEDIMYENGLELDTELETSGLDFLNYYGASNGYDISVPKRSLDKCGHDKVENNIEAAVSADLQYDIMSLDNRLLLELQNVGIFPEFGPDVASSKDDELIEDIHRLEGNYQQQASKKQRMLDQLLKLATGKRELQEEEIEQRAMDKLVEMTYEKYMTFSGRNGRSSSTKIAQKAYLPFVKRAVERCQKYEDTGKSCFNEGPYKNMLLSGVSHLNEAYSEDATREGGSSKVNANTPSSAFEPRVSASMGSLQSPSLTPRFDQNVDSHDIISSDPFSPAQYSLNKTSLREDTWSNRVKKREVLLDNVGGTIVNSLSSSTKGKRSDRDAISKDGNNTKIGRPSLSNNNTKGERRNKAKPKMKTTHLSASSEQPKPRSSEQKSGVAGRTVVDESDAMMDLSNLQIPGMDVFGAPDDDLVGQGEDLGSWFNIDDEDVLQDDDFMGLEIPMDDLSFLT